MGWNAETLIVGTALFLGTTLLSLLVGVFVVLRIPEDYFVARRRPVPRNRVAHVVLFVLKNLAGAIVVAVGLVLSIPGVPGQGFLTIILGALLLDFPGKYRLEQRIVGSPRVLAVLNRLRVRRGREPLLPPPSSTSSR